MPNDPFEQQRRNQATFAALAGVVLVSMAMLGLAALVIPDILMILLVLAGMLVIGLIQYVTWGWMLDKHRIRDEDDPAGK